MKRALGIPASPPPTFEYWLYGLRNGTEIIVLSYDDVLRETTFTGVVARIDPPLLLGLGVRPHRFLEKLFGARDIRIGVPTADNVLHIEGFDERPATLLSPLDGVGRALLRDTVELARVEGLEMKISDSLVLLSRALVGMDASTIATMADQAVHLASAYAARRRAVPSTPSELAIADEWQRFAERESFAFDPLGMKLEGDVAGSRMEIALETDGQLVRTTVAVRFPRAVDVAFLVSHTDAPAFLRDLFRQNIRVGDPVFDEQYKVTGRPEHAVREALARPAILEVLKELGARTKSVQMNHEQLYFRVAGVAATASQLSKIAKLGRTTSAALFREVEKMGPYR